MSTKVITDFPEMLDYLCDTKSALDNAILSANAIAQYSDLLGAVTAQDNKTLLTEQIALQRSNFFRQLEETERTLKKAKSFIKATGVRKKNAKAD